MATSTIVVPHTAQPLFHGRIDSVFEEQSLV